MANKSRMLYLLHYLQACSNEDCPVTTAQIRSALKEKGCPVTVETLRDDIAAMMAAGYDIVVNESNGQTTTYSFVDRPLDIPELQILIDAVSSSQFISHVRSQQLITKLIHMAGPSNREKLRPGSMPDEFIKTSNSQLLYTVQTIQQAIQSDSRITFQYFEYNLAKEYVPRHNGKWYVISPYATIWKNERYFLVGWSEEREKVIVFRVDRMGVPRLTQQPRAPAPASFDIRDYTERVFNMYNEGPVETVTLRCRRHIISHIIDYFGKDVEPYNITEETFDADIRVCVSATLFGWVLGFGDDMTIAGPESVCEQYRNTLSRAAERAERE